MHRYPLMQLGFVVSRWRRRRRQEKLMTRLGCSNFNNIWTACSLRCRLSVFQISWWSSKRFVDSRCSKLKARSRFEDDDKSRCRRACSWRILLKFLHDVHTPKCRVSLYGVSWTSQVPFAVNRSSKLAVWRRREGVDKNRCGRASG